ncbi:hypothetical protein CLU79DRAFT_717308 [Phycomyces nitens]|nr:hypothetical protein CLU79DRAFT_717308 [Phycomyces nitens]
MEKFFNFFSNGSYPSPNPCAHPTQPDNVRTNPAHLSPSLVESILIRLKESINSTPKDSDVAQVPVSDIVQTISYVEQMNLEQQQKYRSLPRDIHQPNHSYMDIMTSTPSSSNHEDVKDFVITKDLFESYQGFSCESSITDMSGSFNGLSNDFPTPGFTPNSCNPFQDFLSLDYQDISSQLLDVPLDDQAYIMLENFDMGSDFTLTDSNAPDSLPPLIRKRPQTSTASRKRSNSAIKKSFISTTRPYPPVSLSTQSRESFSSDLPSRSYQSSPFDPFSNLAMPAIVSNDNADEPVENIYIGGIDIPRQNSVNRPVLGSYSSYTSIDPSSIGSQGNNFSFNPVISGFEDCPQHNSASTSYSYTPGTTRGAYNPMYLQEFGTTSLAQEAPIVEHIKKTGKFVCPTCSRPFTTKFNKNRHQHKKHGCSPATSSHTRLPA